MPFIVSSETSIYGEEDSSFRDYGDHAVKALTVGALGGSLIIGDYEGAWQFIEGTVVTQVVVEGLKKGYGRMRPSNTSAVSFPSGHSAGAFSAAAYVAHRYGSQWNIPMYTLAGMVSLSRMRANQHYLDDVMTGASIAVFDSLIFTTPYNQRSNFHVRPYFFDDSIGLQANYQFDKKVEYQPKAFGSGKDKYEFQYELMFGGATTKTNTFKSDTLDSIDLTEFDQEREPATYAAFKLSLAVSERNLFELTFTPFETRDQKKLTEDFKFQDVTYKSGETLVSAFQLYTLSLFWYYDIFYNTPWITQLGLGVFWQHQTLRFDNLKTNNKDQLSEQEEYNVFPQLFARLGYKITDSLIFSVRASGVQTDDFEHMNYQARLTYDITSRWMVGMSYGENRGSGMLTTTHADGSEDDYDRTTDLTYYAFIIGYRFN